MSLNSADRAWFASYEALPPALTITVDLAVSSACLNVEQQGMRAANDDRRAALTAAVTRFVVESAAAK